MGTKLTSTQKRKNKRVYKKIREGFNEVKNKNTAISYKQFKNRVQAQMEVDHNLDLKKAIKKVQNQETFTSAAERSRENFIEALKKDFEPTYKQIRNLNRTEKGHYKKLELEWTQYDGKWGYSFTGGGSQYFIDVSNSPEEVNVYEI